MKYIYDTQFENFVDCFVRWDEASVFWLVGQNTSFIIELKFDTYVSAVIIVYKPNEKNTIEIISGGMKK